jgi:integrase
MGKQGRTATQGKEEGEAMNAELQRETDGLIVTTPKRKGRKRRERGQGGLIKKRGSRNWYLLYYDLNGKQHSESSGTSDRHEAQVMLTSRLETVRKGEQPMAEIKRLRYEDLRAGLVANYKAEGKLTEVDGKLLYSGRQGLLKPLDDFFGGMPVTAITPDILELFVVKRKEVGVSGPSINRHLALLRRAFNLARQKGKIQHVPYFPMSKESEARKGFIEREQFVSLRNAMPENLRPLLTFLYTTGCRFGAATCIQWSWVNLESATIELPAEVTKNDEPLTLPLSTELVAMLKKEFRNESKPVFDAKNWRKEWNKAAIAAGLGQKTGEEWYQFKGIIPHDLRRSAVRNMIRAGVHQTVAMSISGHKTASVFERYNITDVKDKQAAMAKIELHNAL